MNKSWKTSAGGIAMILSALSRILKDYNATGALNVSPDDIGLIGGGLALLFARDNNVSSEAAGAVKPETKEETK